VLINGDDVDALLAHGLQNWLQLVFQYGEVAVDKSGSVAACECRRGRVEVHALDTHPRVAEKGKGDCTNKQEEAY
jgi:hypothetical protein